MIKPQIFLISTIGFLCYALGMSHIKPQVDPYPGSVTSTTKIAKYKDMESKFISQFTFNKYFKPWAGKAVYKGGQRVIGGIFKPNSTFFTGMEHNYMNDKFIKDVLKSAKLLSTQLPDTKINIIAPPRGFDFVLKKLWGFKTLNNDAYEKFEYLREELAKFNITFVHDYLWLQENYQKAYFPADTHHLSPVGALHVFNHFLESINQPALTMDMYKQINGPNKDNTWMYTRSRFSADTYQIAPIQLPSFPSDTERASQSTMFRYYNPHAILPQHIFLYGNSYSATYMNIFISSIYQQVDHEVVHNGNFLKSHSLNQYIANNDVSEILIVALINNLPQIITDLQQSFSIKTKKMEPLLL